MMPEIRETTKASDDEISQNLVGLARKRSDVFGELAALSHFFSILSLMGIAATQCLLVKLLYWYN